MDGEHCQYVSHHWARKRLGCEPFNSKTEQESKVSKDTLVFPDGSTLEFSQSDHPLGQSRTMEEVAVWLSRAQQIARERREGKRQPLTAQQKASVLDGVLKLSAARRERTTQSANWDKTQGEVAALSAKGHERISEEDRLLLLAAGHTQGAKFMALSDDEQHVESETSRLAHEANKAAGRKSKR